MQAGSIVGEFDSLIAPDGLRVRFLSSGTTGTLLFGPGSYVPMALNPNVDFFSASAYHVMGIPDDLFTPIFACSRVVGWTAHLLEQYAANRLFRPDSDYVGAKGLKWKPVAERTA